MQEARVQIPAARPKASYSYNRETVLKPLLESNLEYKLAIYVMGTVGRERISTVPTTNLDDSTRNWDTGSVRNVFAVVFSRPQHFVFL